MQTIIDDLTAVAKGSSGSKQNRLTSKGASVLRDRRGDRRTDIASTDASRALLAVKMLGKDPAGSQIIATRANFSTLLTIHSALKDDAEASNEALRCIANALLLIPEGRFTFVQKDVAGGDAMVDLLEVCLP